jgi:hypothetical protein
MVARGDNANSDRPDGQPALGKPDRPAAWPGLDSNMADGQSAMDAPDRAAARPRRFSDDFHGQSAMAGPRRAASESQRAAGESTTDRQSPAAACRSAVAAAAGIGVFSPLNTVVTVPGHR